MTRILIELVIVVGLCFAPACAKAPPNLTPVGLHSYTADQVAVRVAEVQNAAIAAEASGALPTATTRIIVQFAVVAADTLKAVPNGWPQTIATAWTAAKQQIGPMTNPLVATAMGALDVVIAGIQP
jgi:hypothetical protein